MTSSLTLTVLFVLATAVAAYPNLPKGMEAAAEKLKKYKGECMEELKISNETMKAYYNDVVTAHKNNEDIPEPPRDFGCCAACIMKKNNQMDADGKMKICESAKNMEGSEEMQKCLDAVTVKDECLRGIEASKCGFKFAETKFGKNLQGINIEEMLKQH